MFPDTLQTRRLLLRPPRLDDAQPIFERYARDPEVTRFLTFRPHRHLSDTQAFVQGCIDAWAGDTRRPWVLTGAEDGGVLGMLDLHVYGYRTEVGYVLARPHWGQGLMTEALQAVADLVLEQPDIYRIGAVCDVDNIASARVLEKVGMQREGMLRRFIRHPNVSEQPRDVFSYAKVR